MTMQMKKQIFFVVKEHHLIELEEMEYFRRPVLSTHKENDWHIPISKKLFKRKCFDIYKTSNYLIISLLPYPK